MCFPKSSCTVEEKKLREIGAVMMEEGSPNLTNTDSDSNSVDQIYDIGVMKSRIIDSVKVASTPSRNASELKATVQYVPKTKTHHCKVLHSTVSPEELSRDQTSKRDNIQDNPTTHSLSSNATI